MIYIFLFFVYSDGYTITGRVKIQSMFFFSFTYKKKKKKEFNCSVAKLDRIWYGYYISCSSLS